MRKYPQFYLPVNTAECGEENPALYKSANLAVNIIKGGSDKSGIFFFFLLNGTTQLKISRFY
jgi:hypothetical protein